MIIDSINGVTVRNYDFSISQIYKSIYLFLVYYWLIRNKEYKPIYILLVFLVLIFIHLFNYDNVSGIARDVILASKFLVIVVSYYFFKKQLCINPTSFIKIMRLFIFSFFVLLSNLLFGYFGFGYEQYSSFEIGTRGWFYSGNEVNLLFIVLSLFLLSYLQIKRKQIYAVILSLLIIFIGIVLISKTAIIGSIIIIIGLPIINVVINRKIFSIYQIIILGIILILFSSLLINFFLYESKAILRYGNITESKELISIITHDSGRSIRKNNVMESYYDDPKINEILFGASYSRIAMDGSTEIDYIDIFVVFGLVGLILMYGFLIIILIHNIKHKLLRKNSFANYNIFGIVLILLISVTAGHVMMSGLASIILGAYLALPYSENRYI